MKFATTAELKNGTNAVLRRAERGQLFIVTRHGKPVAALRGCTEDDLEDFILETSAGIHQSVKEAERDLRAGRGVPLDKYKSPRRARRK